MSLHSSASAQFDSQLLRSSTDLGIAKEASGHIVTLLVQTD